MQQTVIIGIIIIILLTILIVMTRNESLIEPNTNYQSYQNNNPMILAEKNAANIQFIKQQLDELTDIKKKMEVLNNSVEENSYNIQQISKIAASHANQITGAGEAPPIKTPSS